jgi:4'-phosphopantetheinyl transferase EntD
MCRGLFPKEVIVCEGPLHDQPAELTEAEASYLVGLGTVRRREFITGRSLARQALELLGGPSFSLLPGPQRAPLWPAGYSGSITHTGDWCGVAVTRCEIALGLGLDLLELKRMTPKLFPKFMTPAELAKMALLNHEELVRQGAAIFSAKEAFFKLQFALTQQWLNLGEMEVTVDELTGVIGLKKVSHPETIEATGRVYFREGMVAVGFMGPSALNS